MLPSPCTATAVPRSCISGTPFSSFRPKPPPLPAFVTSAIEVCRSPTFTALVSVAPVASASLVSPRPLDTSAIWLPPTLSAGVELPAASVVVPATVLSVVVCVPLPSTTLLPAMLVVLPAPSVNCALVRPASSLASFTVSLSVPSATTPMLLSLSRAVSAPPTISSLVLSGRVTSAPVSPPNTRPSFSVATVSGVVLPAGVYSIRVVVTPSTPGAPFAPVMPMMLMPLAPFRPIVPSLPLIATPSAPFSPFTIRVPGVVSSPIVRFGARSNVTSFVPATLLTTMLPSVLFRSTVSPGFTTEPVAASPCAVSVKPLLLIALATSPAVASASGAAGVVTLPSAAAVTSLVIAAMLPSALTVVVTPSVFAATVYVVLPSVLVVGVTLTPWSPVTVDLDAVSWFMFTASVPATPGATFVITVLLALMPLVVMLGPSVTTKPVLDVTVPVNTGASAICTLIAPDAGSVTVFTLAPL